MYRWLRNIHLWLGLLCGVFLLVYGVSAVQMSHNGWFTLRPAMSETRLVLSPEAAEAPRVAARELMDVHGLRGELRQVQPTPKGFRFRLVRPGTLYEVDFDRVERTAAVRTSVAGFLGMLNRIHHLAGVHHDWALLNVWGAFVAFVSASLLVLGVTGLYLWFKLVKERRIGIVLLAASLAYSLPLIIAMRLG